MTSTFARNTLIATLIASVGLTGCVTTGTTPSQQSSGDSFASSTCESGLAAIAGAVVGGLVSSGNNRLRGAAVGAGLASLACMAWNYNAKQTKTAEQVQREYKQANSGQLPTQSRVVGFNTTVDPSAKVSPGGKVTVTSNIEVVQGTDGRTPVVEEELTLVKPDNSVVKTRKRANENAGGGAFSTTFSMTMPQGVPQGEYPVKTALYLDGKPAGNNDLKLQVVTAPNGELVASIR